jgi:hypothetical protein
MATLGKIMSNLSAVSMELGLYRSARRQNVAALSAKRRAGAGPLDVGRTLFNAAELSRETGDFADAVARARDSIPLLTAAGHWRLAAAAEGSTALALLCGGDMHGAVAATDRAYALLTGHGHDDRRMEAIVRMRSSVVQHAVGNVRAARDDLATAVEYVWLHSARDRDELANTLDLHAWHLAERDPTAAATLVDTAGHLRLRPVPDFLRSLRDSARARAGVTAADPRGGTRARAVVPDRPGLRSLCDLIGSRTADRG